jgi:F-type H+-transporting ATPase subunit c
MSRARVRAVVAGALALAFAAIVGTPVFAQGAGEAAEGIARQPSAADKITGAVNLPLFLLEGVAIIAEVGVLLIVLTK